MQDITDLVSDLDYECKDNRDFHNTMRNKFNLIDTNTSEIERLKAIVDDLRDNMEKRFTASVLDKVYPVGSVYISFEERNPSLFLGGSWTQISGKFLLGVDGTHKVASTGGEEFHKLTVEELPAHKHSTSNEYAGEHTHTRGTMEITGTFSGANLYSSPSGAFANAGGQGYGPLFGAGDIVVNFYASRSWIGATSVSGGHTHNTVIEETGQDLAHNNMPPYIAVYMYRRTA